MPIEPAGTTVVALRRSPPTPRPVRPRAEAVCRSCALGRKSIREVRRYGGAEVRRCGGTEVRRYGGRTEFQVRPGGFEDQFAVRRTLRILDEAQRPKQAVRLLLGPGREVQRVSVAGGHAVAEDDAPQPVDHDRPAGLVLQLAEEFPVRRIEGLEMAVSEVADNECAAERPEIPGRQREAPRRVQMVPADQTLQQMTVRVEDIHEPRSAIGFFVWFLMALLGVGDI